MPGAAERAIAAFRAGLGRPPALLARAPGRVNLIGEHVDYSEGFVLPVAVDREVAVAASPGTSGQLTARAADLEQEDRFDPSAPFAHRPGWSGYVRGVAAVLTEAGCPVGPADLAIAGDVPRGAGLASSAALEVAVARALLALAGRALPDLELARLCRRAEVEKVGVACGIMDQCAAILGRAGHAVLLDCRSLDYQRIPIPPGVALVVCDTGTRRNLQDSAFNERFRECREASERLGVGSLREVPLDHLEERLQALPEPLRHRARHVVREIDRTVRAARALERGDLKTLGCHMDASHAGLRDDYQVSTAELDALVTITRAIPGVYGSRMSGAGFGGCTLSLVSDAALADFPDRVREGYRGATGREATVFVCRPSDGASVREPDDSLR